MTAIITCRNAEHEVNDVDIVNDCIPCIPTTIPGQQSALRRGWFLVSGTREAAGVLYLLCISLEVFRVLVCWVLDLLRFAFASVAQRFLVARRACPWAYSPPEEKGGAGAGRIHLHHHISIKRKREQLNWH